MADDHYTPTMRAYMPTRRDRLAQTLMGDHKSSSPYGELVSRVVGSSGLGESHASPLDFIPAVGPALNVQEDLQHGHYGRAALDATVGWLPFSRAAGGVVRDIVRGMTPAGYRAARAADGRFFLEPVANTGEWAHYKIVNPEAQRVGSVSVANETIDAREAGLPDLYVGWVGHAEDANSLGPTATRDIYRELAARYPEAQSIGGFRVSGAGPGRRVSVPLRTDSRAPELWDDPARPKALLQTAGTILTVPAAIGAGLAAVGAAEAPFEDPNDMHYRDYDEYFHDFSASPTGYAEGGSPLVGEPAIVGETLSNVQLTPVDHDPFDDTIAQRAARTISALAQHAADWQIVLHPVDHDPFN